LNRNGLHVIIGLLAIVVLVLGYQLYQERHNSGVKIDLGGGKVSIQAK
jgi:hypothetical protein